ncbi:MAG: DUF4398 domain-containing protein [Methylobacter sp.]|nr:DUF4398 domain-containing protein [Methylobacter sp.]MDP2098804.1 DUF4398 domain-containing protein [Methylobacter sp.]MDP2428549.1 DUF4398 domain-containing protein [Methylobacter sp.]MDP3054095.1 DUF4398 domain-containing protein [Methylobacter sp.]MDP3363131.1 DUF4398 domain-containing protein [Methylobacter sp.]
MKNSYRFRQIQLIRGIGLTVAVAAVTVGCASLPPPTEQMAMSKLTVSNAGSAGGSEFAPLQLKSALDKMDAAERAMAKEDYLNARQLAEQAQVDAELASVMARSAKAQKAAGALREGIRVLRQEIDRNAQ